MKDENYKDGFNEDPWKSPKMPDPKIPNFRDFYPHENWRFLSVFQLNPGWRPIFIRTIDQAKNFPPRFAGHLFEVLDMYIPCFYVVSILRGQRDE